MYAVHNDHLATPQVITDSNQDVVWQVAEQTPFGEVSIDNDPDGDGSAFVFNVRFPGQYWDEETQTSYNYFRNYDPSLGRYLQSDPIGLQGGVNTYGYVLQNPLKYIDLLGLKNGDILNENDLQRWNTGDASAYPASANDHSEEVRTPCEQCEDAYYFCIDAAPWYSVGMSASGGLIGGGIGLAAGLLGKMSGVIGSSTGSATPHIADAITGTSVRGIIQGCKVGYQQYNERNSCNGDECNE